MNPGIYDISNEAYHSSPGISRSGIMRFMRSPLHYWHDYLNPLAVGQRERTTQAAIIGNALHTIILEPDLFESRFYVAPQVDRRTKEGKQLWQELERLKGNRQMLLESEYGELRLMSESVNSNYHAESLITGAQYEKSLYWNDPDTGILCKARPDILHSIMIGDLKTTADASFNSFQKSIYQYGYHIQCAMLQDAAKEVLKRVIEDFIFICIEKEPPYAVGIYMLSKEAIKEGRARYKSSLLDYKECLNKNEWPSYPISEISLPRYAFA